MAKRAEVGTDPSGRPATIAGAVTAWLLLHDSRDNRYRLRHFAAFAGQEYLDDVGRDLLERFRLYLKGVRVDRIGLHAAPPFPLGPDTIYHYVAAARRVVRWAVDNEWIARMPVVPKLPRGVRKPRDIPPAQLATAFLKVPWRARRVLRFILATGCRPSEACGLRWSDVRLDAGTCLLTEHKTGDATGKPRTIYLTAEAVSVLAEVRAGSDGTGPVFVNRFGRAYKAAGLNSIFKRHTGYTPYQLRHSFAQVASDQLAEEVLGKLLGHQRGETTRRYYEVRNVRAVAAAESLPPMLKMPVGA